MEKKTRFYFSLQDPFVSSESLPRELLLLSYVIFAFEKHSCFANIHKGFLGLRENLEKCSQKSHGTQWKTHQFIGQPPHTFVCSGVQERLAVQSNF